MAHDTNCPPTELKEALRYAQNKSLSVIVESDVNAHHYILASSDENDRREILCEFITENELHVVNKGHEPTFITASRTEVLDVTMLTTNILKNIENWKVDQDESLSDHRYISFQFETDLSQPIQYRNRNKTNFDKYPES